jgi:hypothetical protein
MRVLFHKHLRVAGAMAVLAVAFTLSPVNVNVAHPFGYVSALAGEQGGAGDKQPETASYTNYSATQDQTATPCQSCYMGAGLAGTLNKAPAAVPATPRCDSCVKGS